MINDFLIWFLGYVQYILILPLAIGIYNRKFLQKESSVIYFYILLGVFFEFLSRFLMFLNFENTLPLLHLYTVLEFSIIWLFYYLHFGVYYSQKKMKALLIFFIISAILNAIFFQKINTFNTYIRSIESLVVISLSLLSFKKILIELNTRFLTQQPVFWINTGFLFYFSGNLVVFTLSNYFSNDNHLLSVSWGIHAILMFILNCFIAIGIWQTRPR